jgi:nucleoside-diphosphate-sugar epimerase
VHRAGDMSRRALITGGAGFIGSHLSNELRHPGEDYLAARDGAAMLARHTRAHRVDELLAILAELAAPAKELAS